MISGSGSSEFQDPKGPNAIKYDISLVFLVNNLISKLKPSTQLNSPSFRCLLTEVLVGVAHGAVDASKERVILS